MKMMRYHLQLNRRRTTVILDEIIDKLLAIKFDERARYKRSSFSRKKITP